ncbi:glycosyltransferase family protein [Winogradskyella aurantiaca]|uniref:glycosyltransferase family 1 protein n=1 Tax=Winogradskyella aurantiaca TaxID=2219558 RepID=UPI000E1DDB4A|nr:glycosyltransferase family 1 protein [Winogradskyella aurantiaca]
MSKYRILILAESIDIDKSSGVKGRLALIQAFQKLDYAITVLHYSQKDIDLEGISCMAVYESKSSFLYVLSRIQRLLNRWFGWDLSDVVDKLFGFSFGFFNDSRSMRKSLKSFNSKDYDMVWTLSMGNSYRTHKAVLDLEEWHENWYAYVHDPFPQQLYPRPYNYVPHGYRKKRMFFRAVCDKAFRVVFPSLGLKEWLQSYYTPVLNKSLVIPHQIPEGIGDSMKLPEFFRKNCFSILHAGNLLDLRDPSIIIEAYTMFLQKYPEASEESSLMFIGKSSVYTEYLKGKYKELPSLYVSGDYMPFEIVYNLQNTVSVNVILEAKSEISPFLPGKFSHCVTADKPIIFVGPYYSECKRLLGDEYPYIFDFDKVKELSQAIGKLYKQWKTNPGTLVLNRPDLMNYLSKEYLKDVIENDKLI